MKIEDIARVAHEINRAYCEVLEDFSQPVWEEAPAWQRDSAIAGVRAVQMDPDAGPEASHESWLAHKEAEGWVWGEKKDPEARTHPCMVDYNKLPRSQRIKDHLFLAAVRALSGL